MSMIANDTVVRFNYTLTNSDGDVLDKSNGRPLAYLHGHHNIIPGLEAQMEGKGAGDKFTVTVAPKMLMASTLARLSKKCHGQIFKVLTTSKLACSSNHKLTTVMSCL